MNKNTKQTVVTHTSAGLLGAILGFITANPTVVTSVFSFFSGLFEK